MVTFRKGSSPEELRYPHFVVGYISTSVALLGVLQPVCEVKELEREAEELGWESMFPRATQS